MLNLPIPRKNPIGIYFPEFVENQSLNNSPYNFSSKQTFYVTSQLFIENKKTPQIFRTKIIRAENTSVCKK